MITDRNSNQDPVVRDAWISPDYGRVDVRFVDLDRVYVKIGAGMTQRTIQRLRRLGAGTILYGAGMAHGAFLTTLVNGDVVKLGGEAVVMLGAFLAIFPWPVPPPPPSPRAP